MIARAAKILIYYLEIIINILFHGSS